MNIRHKSLLFGFTFMAIYLINTAHSKVTYTFREFPYKETPKNEAIYQEHEAECALSCSGTGKSSLVKTLCTRQCMSPSCFADLYEEDLLEEGEVDVRLNSFKGCFIQRQRKVQ